VSVFEEIREDLKEAMRGGDTVARDALRMVLAALQNRRIETGEDLSTEDALRVISQQVKTRQDSLEQYERAGREDLAAKERGEIDVLRRYLPEELSDERTREIVQENIAELGIESKRDLGRLMKTVLAEYKGRVSGKLVQQYANEILS
jgi:uncharacterized protein YqeY